MTSAHGVPSRVRRRRSAGTGERASAAPPRVSLLLLSLALLALPAPIAGQDLPEPAQNALAGARVFGSLGCIECHGVRGVGGREAPDLGRIGERRSFYGLGAVLWNHLPLMGERMRETGAEAPPAVTARQAGDLIAFLYTIDYFEPPGSVDRGQELFFQKRCVLCHQAGGVGGVAGPNLDIVGRSRSPIAVAAAMWSHGPAMAEEMRARGIERPAFSGSELNDLVAFLEAASDAPPTGEMHVLPGRAARGRELFRDKGCAGCHGARGRGGGGGPNLAARGVDRGLMGFAAAMWNKAPAMTRAMGERGVVPPRLTASEMADIVAYLYSLRYFVGAGDPARGRAVLSGAGCLACHVAGRAPDLADRRYRSEPAVLAALWNHVRVEADPARWPTLDAGEVADLVSYFLAPAR